MKFDFSKKLSLKNYQDVYEFVSNGTHSIVYEAIKDFLRSTDGELCVKSWLKNNKEMLFVVKTPDGEVTKTASEILKAYSSESYENTVLANLEMLRHFSGKGTECDILKFVKSKIDALKS